MNEQPSPEFEKELRETLSAPGAHPTFVHDLRATILERATMKQTRTFTRLAWGLALAILLIGLLVASPRVAEALKRILGYVPGVGYVEKGDTLRMLSAPVTLEKDGLKLTLERGAADLQRTVLLGQIEGNFTPDRNNERYCDTPPRLVLPDGKTLGLRQSEMSLDGSKGSPSGAYYVRYVFEAMPVEQLEATLEIPCLMNDTQFRDWRLEINFEIAKDAQVMPVIELPTAPAEEVTSPSQPVTASAATTGITLEGFSVVFESESPLPDGYILSGSYQWTDPRFDAFSIQTIYSEIADANGGEIAFEPVDPLTALDPALKKMPFAYQIHGKDYAWPLTFTVKSVTIQLPDAVTFQFDAGPDPQVGQTWDVNIDVPVAGHVIHVQTIELTEGRTPTELGFTFTMTADPGVMGASIDDANPVLTGDGNSGGGGGGGGGDVTAAGPFTYGWALDHYSPAGVKTFTVTNVAVMLQGTWQATWQPSGQ